MNPPHLPNGNGNGDSWREQKLLFGAGVCLLMFTAFLLTAKWGALATSLPTLITGLCTVFGIFAGGHALVSWVNGRNGNGNAK